MKTLLPQIQQCDNYTITNETYYFKVLGYKVGIISFEVYRKCIEYINILKQEGDIPYFIADDNTIELNPDLDTIEKRNEAINQVLLYWKQQQCFSGTLNGWRNELYPVYASVTTLNDTLCFQMERAGSFLFGINTFGAHINGYTIEQDEMKIWIAKRSMTKQTWPGMLDNMCAGGVAYGDSIEHTVIKECLEEGNLPKEVSEKAKFAGLVTYITQNQYGLSPETQYIYDLELPIGVIPKPNDGEVEGFYKWSVQEVLDRLYDNQFKPNCGLIMIDFLIRHGFLNPKNEPNLHAIQAHCHRPPLFFP